MKETTTNYYNNSMEITNKNIITRKINYYYYRMLIEVEKCAQLSIIFSNDVFENIININNLLSLSILDPLTYVLVIQFSNYIIYNITKKYFTSLCQKLAMIDIFENSEKNNHYFYIKKTLKKETFKFSTC